MFYLLFLTLTNLGKMSVPCCSSEAIMNQKALSIVKVPDSSSLPPMPSPSPFGPGLCCCSIGRWGFALFVMASAP